MKILVYDIAASNRGALSVLQDFHQQVLENGKKNEWHFIISTPELKEDVNVHVHRFPWIKNNPINRLFFDNFVIQRLIIQLKIDLIVSLQNVCVSRCNIPQRLVLHNALPFHKCDKTVLCGLFNILKQKYLNRKILKSLKLADKLIVPNEWIYNACSKISGIDIKRIKIVKPILEISVPKEKYSGLEREPIEFFYPANAAPYKRHDLLVEACTRIPKSKYSTFSLILTTNGNENAYIKKYKSICELKQLPIHFHGAMSREEVMQHYCQSVLLFPSEIETDALPLLEAMMCNSFIIATKTDFAECILKNYPNCILIQIGDEKALAEAMCDVLSHKKISVEYKYEQENTTVKKDTLIRYLLED
ncbi:MAG: glycosyltransferase [Treponema sp.]|nr:glycosyltransferase [Treponema sp.]